MNLLLSIIIIVSFTLIIINHPLSIGFILIIQTIITAIIIGYILKSFLFSYIIIIIMLSGVLVLFIYIARVASNEKFNISIKIITLFFVSILILSILIFFYNKKPYLINLNIIDTTRVIKLFNTLTAQLTLIVIIYLLLTIIIVSNIARVTDGPLRIKN